MAGGSGPGPRLPVRGMSEYIWRVIRSDRGLFSYSWRAKWTTAPASSATTAETAAALRQRQHDSANHHHLHKSRSSSTIVAS